MIGFKDKYLNFVKSYNERESRINFPSNLEIVNCHFISKFHFNISGNGFFRGDLFYHELVRSKVPENTEFVYPVVVPNHSKSYDRAILLFHGLNEKSWDKYFVWATYLAEKTICPVILFPLAYHINRVPKTWSDPRLMSDIVSTRKKTSDSNNATFANAALSTRLQFHPELFLYSGLQSCSDVLQLMDEIKSGSSSIFTKDTHFDIFSYSIGAFFSQILMLTNPGGRFNTSKLFIFCGGSTFDQMKGNSKFIMDSTAFTSLLGLKQRQKMKQIKKKVFSFGNESLMAIWSGLELMMHHRRGRKKRELLFEEMKNRVFAVALEKDQVMPVESIITNLRGRKKRIDTPVEVIDFPFGYSHEQPFPMGDEKIQNLVDRSFTVVFDKAVDFFNGSEIIEKKENLDKE